MSILDDAREGMNPDIRPQDDLFGHVNGRWLEETEIPSDRSSWGPFVQLADTAEEQVRQIIEDLAKAVTQGDTDGGSASIDEDARKIGDQLRYAERRGHQVAIICGPAEALSGVVKVKDLTARDERAVAEAEIVDEVRRILGD